MIITSLTMNFLVNITGYLRDNIFPALHIKQSCFLCGKYDKFAICKSCEKTLTDNNSRCHSCGIIITSKLQFCIKCLQTPQSFTHTFVLYQYADWVRVLIHNFKYQHKLPIGKFFAYQLQHKIIKLQKSHNFDAIIPMPLHNTRLQERGFHQVMELLQQVKTLKIDNTSLKRIKATKELHTLKAKERNSEITGAFVVSKSINYQHILIVDDVMTTGSSANELAKTILKYYKKQRQDTPKIDILVLARTDS